MTQGNPKDCDSEPIHIPGSIQPHGALIALEGQGLQVLHVSANIAAFFGVAPEAALGRSLSALVGPAVSEALLDGLEQARSNPGDPFDIIAEGQSLHVRAHWHRGVAILEVERHDPAAATIDAVLRGALARLQRAHSASELLRTAVEAIRALTGFDRVLLYRFDEAGHGDVIEESLADGMDSYLGLRFPASDIPRQARELYLLNWLRVIPNASYVPVPLIRSQRAGPDGPLDLSFASLRSVSPLHLEYLRNMGVGASMSVSVVRANRLWGLLACHHRVPRQVSFAAQAACELIGRVVALQSAAQDEIDARALRDVLHGAEARLAEVMRDAPGDVACALLQRSESLLQLVGASGAAVCTPTGIQTIGVAPSVPQIAALVRWVVKQGCVRTLQTDALGERNPDAADYAAIASGVLAMTLPGAPPSHVLWFRPEVVQTVSWAGNPEPSGDGGSKDTLHPRHSFAAWKQIVRGRSRAWSSVEVDAAEDLRRRAIEVDLAKQITRAQEAVRLRDEMVAVLSHDLRNPLQVMEMATAILAPRIVEDARAAEMIARLRRALGLMNGLILNLLDLAKIEAGRFEVVQTPTRVEPLLFDALSILTPIAEAKGIHLSWTGHGDACVAADAERMFQVFSNLVGNAIKFTPVGGTVTIVVESQDGWVRFTVRDTGPGIAATELAHIFERYWQPRRSQSTGAGLGLYIAKGLVEAHGGSIWAYSDGPGTGTSFVFTLPPATLDAPSEVKAPTSKLSGTRSHLSLVVPSRRDRSELDCRLASP